MDSTLEQSVDSTLSTPLNSEGRRWNLRRRKTPPSEVEDSSVAMETSTEPSPLLVTSTPMPRHAGTAATAKKRKLDESKVAGSAKKKTRKSATVAEEEGEGHQLYGTVMGGRSALQSVASDWVDRYEHAAEEAMVELIQYFVLCCGCRATISLDMYQHSGPSDVIRSLTENFDEESGEYPLIMPGPAQKKFKANFVEFLFHIVQQCRHSILYDEYMLDTLIAWLVGFTDSQVRAFRHTATLACTKLVTSLVGVAKTVNSELDNTQRQIDAERKRQLSKKGAAGKLEKLVTKKGELQQHIKELDETMRGLFSSVFVHRYRDVRSEVRAICITELGEWMAGYSATFLSDSYLKYIGWTLYDKAGEVRLACVQVLQVLYCSEDTASHLELFTQRFKERVVAMRLDREDAVAVHAIQLCGHLLALDMLEPEDCTEICELVFVENRAVSHAAGQFALGYLFSDEFMAKAKQAKVPKGCKRPSDNQIMLRELVRFFLEVKVHEHAAYFVDSLWEHTDVLKDWEAMVGLLLEEKGGVQLNDEEEALLIELMTCAVQRATGANPPAGRSRGRMLSNKEKRAMEEAKEALSSVLMVAMPDLISKYGSEASRAANLASIPQQFELELYTEHRLQKHLESLLTHLHQLTVKHLEPTVLDECARTYHYFLTTDFTLLSTVEVAFTQLVDELVLAFHQYSQHCKDQSLVEDNEDTFGMAVSLRRIGAFYKCHNLSSRKLGTDLIALLDTGVTNDCSEKILVEAILCLKLEVMWSLKSLDEQNPNREDMRQVRSSLLLLVQQCHELLKFGRSAVQRDAFVALCDLLVAFAKQLRCSGQLGALVYSPGTALQQTMLDYVLEEVLGGMEEEVEEHSSNEEAMAHAERLNDGRVLLAGFLKLAMFLILDMKLLAPVFRHYLTQFHNFGDLMKHALGKCRDASPMSWYRMVLLALQQAFTALREGGGGYLDQAADEWTDLKELARRFSLSFGFDRYDTAKVRQPLAGIHRDGISFALARPEDETEEEGDCPPPNLAFLLVLSEFSPRLIPADRNGAHGVVPYLESMVPEELWGRVEGEEGWEPLRAYRASLVWKGDPSEEGNQSRVGKGRSKGAANTSKSKKRPLKATAEGDGWVSTRPSKVPRLQPPPEEEGEEEEEGEDTPV